LGIDLFRLGIAVILLALMFPLAEAVDKYLSPETMKVMFALWVIGLFLLFMSAFVTGTRHSRDGGARGV